MREKGGNNKERDDKKGTIISIEREMFEYCFIPSILSSTLLPPYFLISLFQPRVLNRLPFPLPSHSQVSDTAIPSLESLLTDYPNHPFQEKRIIESGYSEARLIESDDDHDFVNGFLFFISTRQ